MKPLDFNPTGMTAEEWHDSLREHNLIKEIIYLRACNRKIINEMGVDNVSEITYKEWLEEFEIQTREQNDGKFFKCRW